MPLIPLKFRPGMVRDLTNYGGAGGWYDCNWVRFRAGLPEKMGGWTQKIATTFLGICRKLVSWTLLDGSLYLALGTNLKFYVSDESQYTDVTPIRATNSLGANPFMATNGSTSLVVTSTAHGAVVNDFVTFSGATGFANILAADLNKEFQIVTVVDANTYTVTLGVTPNATMAGGGAAVTAAYQINTGLNTSVTGLGWGAGSWGRGTWGSDATSGPSIQLRLWSADTFGQDLIANVRNGGIYHWDATNPTNRMVALVDLPGQSNAPKIATAILVSPEEQHTIAFGCDPLDDPGVQDPMFVRWADAESYLNWTPTDTNSAGGYRLSVGTEIVGVQHGKGQILIFTDVALYTMTWTGVPYTFNFQLAGYNVSLMGPNAAIAFGDVTYWMGDNQFYMYDGRIQPMDCPISDYIFERLNVQQFGKVYAFTNVMFNEVGWLYQSNDSSDDCDSYVILNVKDGLWYFGSLERTAWLDLGGSYYPLATSVDSYLYNHEFGTDDGSTNPPSGITAYIESSPMETGQDGMGDHFIFMDRLIPDITFRNSTATSPTATMTLETRDYPGGSVSQTQANSVVQTATVPVDEFTNQCYVRLRGRSAIFRVESSDTGVTWRLGVPRVSYRIDGRR